jgi:hypothetical protein
VAVDEGIAEGDEVLVGGRADHHPSLRRFSHDSSTGTVRRTRPISRSSASIAV